MSTVQSSTVQYSAVQYSTEQYSTVQYSTVQSSTVKGGDWGRSWAALYQGGTEGSTVRGSSVSPAILGWRECAGEQDYGIKLTAQFVKTTTKFADIQGKLERTYL